jgi:hypothetical protein
MAEEVEKISKIISIINPDLYFDGTKEQIKEFKQLIKEKGFEAALEKAKPKPAQEHKLVYDSTSEGLEPIYFWLVDKMNDFFGGSVEKIIDTFTSSPGSGHFSELMGKATKMQEESMKILGMVNNVVKGVLNLIYDLKNFRMRIAEYEKAKSKNPEEAKGGQLALKQIWMDNVDIKRGRGSINNLAYDLDFATIRDAFMTANSPEDITRLDLNDRVKNILRPRIQEFLEWKIQSEAEIRKRYEIEKSYLKSQLESMKLYSRWAKPYLVAAARLEQKEPGRKPEMVTVFNTIMMELILLGKNEVKVEKAIMTKELPIVFKKIKFKRKYYSCIVIDFYFRGVPYAIGGGRYSFGGRTEVVFRGYALNEDEIKKLNEKLGEGDVTDALKLVEGLTEESMKQMQDDIKSFLEEKKEAIEEKKEETTNPFFALLGLGKKKEKAKEGEKEVKAKEKIEPDNFYEAIVRKLAETNAQKNCFDLFDIYKKAHGMASYPSPFG